eukprot:484306_1
MSNTLLPKSFSSSPVKQSSPPSIRIHPFLPATKSTSSPLQSRCIPQSSTYNNPHPLLMPKPSIMPISSTYKSTTKSKSLTPTPKSFLRPQPKSFSTSSTKKQFTTSNHTIPISSLITQDGTLKTHKQSIYITKHNSQRDSLSPSQSPAINTPQSESDTPQSSSDSDSDSDSGNSDSSLDYEDKLLKKELCDNKDINNDDDNDGNDKKKQVHKINNRSKGIFYCSNIKCNYKLIIKSKKKRMNKKTFKCIECKYKNCIDCNVIHKLIKDKKIRRLDCSDYQFLYNNKFLNNWKKLKIDKNNILNPYKILKKNNKMIKCFKVKRDSIEWKIVISNMQTINQFNVTRIDRIQNSKLYMEYYKHCKKMILKRAMSVNELSVWHGSRQTDPSIIWKGIGFDVRRANVGGCIWFAIQNNYSMGGYQFRKYNGENQVFLAFVATGDYESVKFIRNGQILNVYKNQTMYPAYVVTYHGGQNY